MISSVKVDGATVDLNTVAHDVSITIGRRDLTTTFAPSSCRITFYDVVASTYTALVGKTLTVAGSAYQLFGGYITDVRLTVATETSGARCDIIAAGPSSRLGLIDVNAAGYSSTTLALRCKQIADEAIAQDSSFYFINETGTDEGTYTLASVPAATQSATTALQGTVDQVDGVIYDNPTNDLSPTGQVAYYTNDKEIGTTVVIAADRVLFAPTFEQSGQIINNIVVGYDSGTIQRSNATSQTLYGKRTRTIGTTIVSSTQATDLADEIISRSRRPRWAISDVTITQPASGAETLYSRIGFELAIDSLPYGSPSGSYVGIVQGWEHRITGGTHRTTFYLADPAEVGRSIAWYKVTSSYYWDTINPSVTWDNALTLADFETVGI
jgi:hypothetical protein